MSDSKENHKIWGDLSKNNNTPSENNDDQIDFEPIDENYFDLQFPPALESDDEKQVKRSNKKKEDTDSNSEAGEHDQIGKFPFENKEEMYGKSDFENNEIRLKNGKDNTSEPTSEEEQDNNTQANNSLLNLSNQCLQIDELKSEDQRADKFFSMSVNKETDINQLKPNIINTLQNFSCENQNTNVGNKIELTEEQYNKEIQRLQNIIEELKKQISYFNGWKVELDLELENNLMAVVEYETKEISLRNELEEVKAALKLAKENGRNNFDRRFSFGGKNEIPFYSSLDTKEKREEENGLPNDIDEEVKQLKDKLDEREIEIKKLKQAIEKLSLEKFEESKRIQSNFEQEINEKNNKLETMQLALEKYNTEMKLTNTAVRPTLEKKILEKDLELHNLAIAKEREAAERDLEIKRLNQLLEKIKSERVEEISFRDRTIERLKGEKEAELKRLNDKFIQDLKRQSEEDKKKFSDLISKQREALETKLKSLSTFVSQSLEKLAQKEAELLSKLHELGNRYKSERTSPRFNEAESYEKMRKPNKNAHRRNVSNSSYNSDSSGNDNIEGLRSKLEEQTAIWIKEKEELMEQLEENRSMAESLKKEISNRESKFTALGVELEKAKNEKKKLATLLEKKVAELNQFKEEMSSKYLLENIEENIGNLLTFCDTILEQEAEMPTNVDQNLFSELKTKLNDLINFMEPRALPENQEFQMNLLESLKINQNQEAKNTSEVIKSLESQLQESVYRESQVREMYLKESQLREGKQKELETEFSQDLRRIRENLRQVELANGSLMAEINLLKSENEKFAIKIQQDATQLKEREKKFSQEFKALREKLSSEERKSSSLSEEIRSLREENEKLAMKKLLDSSEESQKEQLLRKEVKDLQEKNKTEELRNENLNSELMTLRASSDKLKSRLVQYQEFYENGRQENIQLGKMLESRINDINDLNERLKTEIEYSHLMLSEIEVLNHLEAHLRGEKKSEENENGADSDEENNEENTESSQQAKPLLKDISINFCIPQTESLKQKLLNFIKERRELWKKLSMLMKKIEEITKDNEESIESYKRELDEKYGLVDYLKRNEEELHVEIQNLKQEAKRQAAKLREKEQLINFTNGEINKKDEKIRNITNDLGILQKDLGESVLKSKEVETVRIALKDIFDKKTRQLDDSDSYYKNVIKGKENIINELTSELREKSINHEQNLKKLQDQISFMESKNIAMKESNEHSQSRFLNNKEKYSSGNEKVFSSVDSEPVIKEEFQRYLNPTNRLERDMTPPTKGLRELVNSLSSSTTEKTNMEAMITGRSIKAERESIDHILMDIDVMEKNLESLIKNFLFVVKFLELELQNGGINEARLSQIKRNYQILLNNNDETKFFLSDCLKILREKILKMSGLQTQSAQNQSPYNTNLSQTNLQQSNVFREEKPFSKSQIPSSFQEPSTKTMSPLSTSTSHLQQQMQQNRSISPAPTKFNLQIPAKTNYLNNQPAIKTDRTPVNYAQEFESSYPSYERGNKTPLAHSYNQEKKSDAVKSSTYLGRRYNKTVLNQDEITKSSQTSSVSIKLYQKKKK